MSENIKTESGKGKTRLDLAMNLLERVDSVAGGLKRNRVRLAMGRLIEAQQETIVAAVSGVCDTTVRTMLGRMESDGEVTLRRERRPRGGHDLMIFSLTDLGARLVMEVINEPAEEVKS